METTTKEYIYYTQNGEKIKVTEVNPKDTEDNKMTMEENHLEEYLVDLL